MFESGAFFEVTDREFHDGVVTVELIDGDGVVGEVGQKRVVPPVGPQFGLVLVGEAGASHDQTPTLIDTLGDLGLPIGRVPDRHPGFLVDRADRLHNRSISSMDRHRVTHPETGERRDRVVRPEPRIETAYELTRRARMTDPGDQLLNEPARTSGRVRLPFPHPGMQHLTRIRAGREQRVITQHFRIPIPGALFLFPVHLTDRRIDIDHQPPVAGTRTERPGTAQRLGDHLVELADMPERERP